MKGESAQGYILNHIKQSLSEATVGEWINQQKLENFISHRYLCLPVRETGRLSKKPDRQEQKGDEILLLLNFLTNGPSL